MFRVSLCARLFTAPVLPSEAWAGPATARALLAMPAASNPQALLARAQVHQQSQQQSVGDGADRLANVLLKGSARLWHSRGLRAERPSFSPFDQDRGRRRYLLRLPPG